MPKLDVGVGDEFPTEEIRRDPDGTIHHHHYYYRRGRRPFGFLRFILALVLIGMVFHLIHLADWTWDVPFLPGYFHFVSTMVGIAVVIGLIWFLRRPDYWDDRR